VHTCSASAVQGSAFFSACALGARWNIHRHNGTSVVVLPGSRHTAGYAGEWRESAVNGDEVRRLDFPRASVGYDAAAVGKLLDRAAAELDAGRPVTPLIEAATFPQLSIWEASETPALIRRRGIYDCAAVDWALSQLRLQDDPEGRADPWQDLRAWHFPGAIPDAGGAPSAVPGMREAARLAAWTRKRWREQRDYARACADAWRDFGLPPGARLSLVKTGARRSELRTAGQYPLVSSRTRTFDRNGRTYRLSRVKAAQWPAVAAEIGDKPPDSPAHLARTESASRTGMEAAGHKDPAARKPSGLMSLTDQTGPPVLYKGGTHFGHVAGGYIEFPGRRWLRFPVRATSRSNAIMTAVNQAGQQVARYRIADRRTIEITVHPDQQLTDELILTLALTAPWASEFFRSGGG